MSDWIIKTEGLGKKYNIGHLAERQRYVALRDVISERVTGLFRSSHLSLAQKATLGEVSKQSAIEEFWALKDVSFEVKQGEVLGIIGRNGAGKSTLLKILSRITEPTEGRVTLRGRVASLLEVGTGFHPELSGRENIYLNGAILGMTRKEIKKKFDEIVAFSEVEKFLDTPVKRYSSGMYVRLAFAVAAHLEPEILVVDEVLAVGDAEFQKKCLGKMRDVSKGGRTVLFVSHNMAAIETLCSRAIYLRDGRLHSTGGVESQIRRYMTDFAEIRVAADRFPRRLTSELEVLELDFSKNPVVSGDSLEFRIGIRTTLPTTVRDLAVLFYSGLGTRVAILDLRSAKISNEVGPMNPWKVVGKIEAVDFVEGDYAVGMYVTCGDARGNFLDLVQLGVLRRPESSDVAPYAAHDRGVLELHYTFNRENSLGG